MSKNRMDKHIFGQVTYHIISNYAGVSINNFFLLHCPYQHVHPLLVWKLCYSLDLVPISHIHILVNIVLRQPLSIVMGTCRVIM